MTTDPGHLLPAAEWARVQADALERAAARPARALAAIAGGLPSVTAFVQCKYDGGPQPGPITFGVLHDAETPLTAGYARSIASYFTRNTNSTSAHFMVDPVDTVQMLATNRIAWHCGNGNSRSVGVEQAGYASFTAAQWTGADGLKQMTRVAALIRDLHTAYGIGRFWMTDQQLVDAHAGRIIGGWATHAQCSRVLGGSSHTDPTPSYPLQQLMTLANQEDDVPYNQWPAADKAALARDIAAAIRGDQFTIAAGPDAGTKIAGQTALREIYQNVLEVRDGLRPQGVIGAAVAAIKTKLLGP